MDLNWHTVVKSLKDQASESEAKLRLNNLSTEKQLLLAIEINILRSFAKALNDGLNDR
ncbi:hypothetical protein IZ6_24730 [Terrihabitans soli]|uniref:Uncharacterized protein n=1 Tax=Terrihabitans soli TaxID=708113 RepID=A0A6S6QYS0_9HYPH|nr:hypothetical protein [Terrihabitans soli]BCJ91738.1 hypothetical protein IZ6_24730 [Terrihabitans soli]